MRPERIPYGVKNFKLVRQEGLYYVDKTCFIAEMENALRNLIVGHRAYLGSETDVRGMLDQPDAGTKYASLSSSMRACGVLGQVD